MLTMITQWSVTILFIPSLLPPHPPYDDIRPGIYHHKTTLIRSICHMRARVLSSIQRHTVRATASFGRLCFFYLVGKLAKLELLKTTSEKLI